jgi:hypothetical protein
MIIIPIFKLCYNINTGIHTVTANIMDTYHRCTICGIPLKYRNSKLRKSIDLHGKLTKYELRRFYCSNCKKLHTEIPDIIQPYKHYDSATIQSVLDGDETANECAADESTMSRWKADFAVEEADIAQRLNSVYSTETNEKAPIISTTANLDAIRKRVNRWLCFVMSMLINHGHKLCTRFAFCPQPKVATLIKGIKNKALGGGKDEQTNKDSS